MIRRLLVLLLLLLPVPAAAQPLAGDLSGSWALRFDGSVIFRFDIERAGDVWRGTWSRPGNFASDGDRFANVAGGTVTISSREGRDFAGWAELTFPDDRPGAVPDIFRFRLLPTGEAEMIYVETGLAPYVLERAAADLPLGPFEPGKVYHRPGTERAPVLRPAPPAPETPPVPETVETRRAPAFEGR